MDLYQLDPPLRKNFSERTSHFQRTDVAPTVSHHGDLSKFPSSDLLSSSAWSSVIHQPDQDSDPEDLPSTVDIDAIKEPPTPVNASAQTPVGQLHGDNNSFELSDEQNVGESASDSDSDSESGNSENENAASGGDSGSCSDSDSVSSHPSSSSSKGKPPSSHSSRSNSPPSTHNSQQQQFAVREANFEQGGLRLKFSALKRPKQKYDNDNAEISSDSSESKIRYDNRLKNKKMYSLKARNDCKNKSAFFSKDQLKRGNSNDKDSDSDSSSSCHTSPEKSFNAWNAKARIPIKSNSKIEPLVNRSKPALYDKGCSAIVKDRNERLVNYSTNKRNEFSRNALSNPKELAQFGTIHSKYRGLNKAGFGPPSLKLPQACKLSEDSDESLDSSKASSKNTNKKENDRDTIEKLAQQLTQPGIASDQLQVLNEEDLAAVLPDVEGNASGVGEFEFIDGSTARKRTSVAMENKKADSSDSSSDTEMFPKQKQIVSDVINSIHIDSDSSNDRTDLNRKHRSFNNDSSSNDERKREKRNEKKSQYSSNLSDPRIDAITRINRNNVERAAKSGKSSITATSMIKTAGNTIVRKRGRPPKTKNSSAAEIETYMRLDCTVSNVSPDSGIQSNAGSPLYHNLHSSLAVQNQNSRFTGNKLSSVPSKSSSLTQKAVLSSSKKKNTHQRCDAGKNIKEILNTREGVKFSTSQLLKNKGEVEKKSALTLKQTSRIKATNETTKTSTYLNSTVLQSSSNMGSLHGDLALFQGKRGPGRPKKVIPAKVNGKTKSEKILPLELDGPYEKANCHAQKPVLISSDAHKINPKKMKYYGPVAMCSEIRKKHAKGKSNLAQITHQSVKSNVSQKMPVFPVRKEWFRKHKKRKKKDLKEKTVNAEVLKMIDDLIESFSKKCVIEERKIPKLTQRLKEKCKKKKYMEKMKHSDTEFECETVSVIPVATNIASSKRRHKKSAIETPKVLQPSQPSKERLPLKKRPYHVSASSITNTGHQNNGENKNRSEKHPVSHSTEIVSPLPVTSDNIAKISENVKPKLDVPKTSSKSDTPKLISKNEFVRSSVKPESNNKISSKSDSQKISSKDIGKNSTKIEPVKSSNKVDCRKMPTKLVNQSSNQNELNKNSKVDARRDESDCMTNIIDVDNDTTVASKKKPRTEEEKKLSHRSSVAKELLPFLPLRRSGRSITSVQKNKKQDSPSPERKSKSDLKSKTIKSKSKPEIEINSNHHSKRNLKRSETSSKTDPVGTIVDGNASINNIISKKEKPALSSIESDISCSNTINHKEITHEKMSAGSPLPSVKNTPTKLQTSNKPQLITPLPSEPEQQKTSTVTLKPPAGVFEPSRKLPTSVSKPKKSSIDDVLSKLKEKLKDLDSPSKNTSALIEKIGVAKNEVTEGSNVARVLRSKRPNSESETLNAKKSKICKDMSIRLRKLSNSELINSGITTTELKPKLKRRKTINRTGFPVKKKKKRNKIDSESAATTNINEEITVTSATEDENTDTKEANSTAEVYSVGKVKNELVEEQGLKNRATESAVLSNSTNKTIKVKSEARSEDETIPVRDLRPAIKNSKKKPVKQDVPNRVLPSRCSARIYIKQQIRAREMKKSKKNSTKKNKNKKGSKILSNGKIQKPIVAKLLKPRKCKEKNISKGELKEELSVKIDSDKDSKSREETDKEEFSDSDSLRYTNSKKTDVPKWKKKYYSAGLFSDFYKEEKHNAVDTKNRFIYKEEDHPHGLLPIPPYVEDEIRGKRADFKLPYDLWWLHSHNQLPGRDDVVHSWNYKKIRTNVYYDVKPTYMYEAQACNCKIPAEKDELGCGEDCINRLVYAECSPELCPLKQKCSNQKIQKHEWAPKLVKFMTTDKGWGVKTKESIKNGNFILEYVGEVVTDKEFKKRMTSLYKNDIHHYCLNLDGGLLIDGHRMGGFGRFVNHSCEPNCEMQKWSVNGLFRMALFALRNIEAGEELTYDYNFALFNPAEGQPCLCGSSKCRGVIGGKSQRVPINNVNNASANDTINTNATNGASSSDKKSNRLRPRKQVRKNTNGDSVQKQRRDSVASSNSVGILPQRNTCDLTPVKPLSPEEKKIVLNFRVFLIRNLKKIQHFREKLSQIYNNKENSNSLNHNCVEDAAAKESAVFVTHFNALSTQRGITTRRLAQAQDNPEVTKTAQLAKVFRTIFNDVVSAKDEKGEPFSALFMTLPSKRKLPTYYQRISDPIDLSTIEKNIVTGMYKNVEFFDKDMKKLIANSVKYYKRTSEFGIAAVRLRKEYNISKLKHVGDLKKIVGETLPSTFMPGQEDPGDEEEDVIRCICGFYKDEGVMIQCERCLVWQHCDCVKGDPNAEHYLCERCNPRDVDYDIPLDTVPEYAQPGEKHYLTLMRDDLQIKQGDTVYVLRDILNPETKSRHTFRTIKSFKFDDCDIFRVERLWINEKGERMSFGHHYLRPHETYHEPTRRFFTNEVVQIPLYEAVPLDLIMGQCYVLNLSTYRKGRPIDSDPQHIYICEFRVDKQARVFFKLRQSKQPKVCTKNYAFDTYDTPLKPTRTYAPHGEVKSLPNTSVASSTLKSQMNNQKVRLPKVEEAVVTSSENSRVLLDSTAENSCSSMKIDEDDLPLSHLKDSKEKQKQRLNTILLKLLAKKSSTKTPLDASYLLDMGRRNRKKPELFST